MKNRILLSFLAAVAGSACIAINVRSQAGVPAPAAVQIAARTYVGSATCAGCHQALYARWSRTRMANVVTDPRQHPELVLPDFSKPDPLLTFKLDDVAFVYGSKWKQRYFTKVGSDYYPLPAQWDVAHRIWRAYMVQPNTDWWVPFYPADNLKRPTGPLFQSQGFLAARGAQARRDDIHAFSRWNGHKNRMQGNDFVQSVMYKHGVTCFSCHDVHGTANNADLIKPPAQMCLTCHGPGSTNGPRGATIEEHTHHAAGSAGSECVVCHMPKIEQTIADINVRSHTFAFIRPELTDQFKIPNSCTSCHTDKSTDWAREALKSWPGESPWRVN